MVTTGFALPGFDMKMRAYRLYKPATDSTKPTGYKFVNDGTALWVAQTPMAGLLQRFDGELPEHLHRAAQRHDGLRLPMRTHRRSART